MMKLRTIIMGIAFGMSASAASACASYNFDGLQGGSWGRFENRCSYPVIMRFRFDNGQSGLAGPMNPGEVENYSHGSARRVNYRYCDWSQNCSPGTPDLPQ